MKFTKFDKAMFYIHSPLGISATIAGLYGNEKSLLIVGIINLMLYTHYLTKTVIKILEK